MAAAMQELEPIRMSGLDKAATLMLSLPEEFVAKILGKMEEHEIKELTQRMAFLGTIRADVVERLYLEFTERVTSTGTVYGSFENTERILTNIFDTGKVKEIMQEIRGPAGRTMWDKLSNVDESVLATYLQNEYPQTVSVVLSKIRADHAARVMALFPESFAMEVINRMLKMEVVQREILDDVENTLKEEFMSNLARTQVKDPFEQMAEMFNSFDRATESRLMGALEGKNAEAAERIKALMFTFDDLVKLDASGVQTLIRFVDKTKLGLALKGANDAIKELFFNNMSERAAKLLKEDMQSMGMVRIKDVDEAQMGIIIQTKELMAKGEITLAQGDDDGMLVG